MTASTTSYVFVNPTSVVPAAQVSSLIARQTLEVKPKVFDTSLSMLELSAFGDGLLALDEKSGLQSLTSAVWEGLIDEGTVDGLFAAAAMDGLDTKEVESQAHDAVKRMTEVLGFGMLTGGRFGDSTVRLEDFGLVDLTSHMADDLIDQGKEGLRTFVDLAGDALCSVQNDEVCNTSVAVPLYPFSERDVSTKTGLESTDTLATAHMSSPTWTWSSPKTATPTDVSGTDDETWLFSEDERSDITDLFGLDLIIQSFLDNEDQFADLVENRRNVRVLLTLTQNTLLELDDAVDTLYDISENYDPSPSEQVSAREKRLDTVSSELNLESLYIKNLLALNDTALLAGSPYVREVLRSVRLSFRKLVQFNIENQEYEGTDDDGEEDKYGDDDEDGEEDEDEDEGDEFSNTEDGPDGRDDDAPANALDVLRDALASKNATSTTSRGFSTQALRAVNRRQGYHPLPPTSYPPTPAALERDQVFSPSSTHSISVSTSVP